jgi:hypothetical protein
MMSTKWRQRICRSYRSPATAVVLSALIGFALSGTVATDAQAENTHEYLSQITEIPVSSGATITGGLSSVSALTVDSSKDLWVAENIEGSSPSVSRVDEFDSSGVFVKQLNETGGVKELDHGIAVGRETGEVYVGAEKEGEHVVAVFSSAGALLGTWNGAGTKNDSFGYIPDLAVDNDSTDLSDEAKGDVYVPDSSNDVVDVFKPEVGGGETYVTEIPGLAPAEVEEERHVSAVAVDEANGDVLVGEDLHDGSTGISSAVVDVYEPTILDGYTLLHHLAGTPGVSFGQVSGLAVDGGDGDIYVTQGEDLSGLPEPQVDQFSEAGAYIGVLKSAPGAGFGRGIGGVVVEPAAPDHLYVGQRTPENSDTEGAVDVFGPTVVIPDVTTGGYSKLAPLSVTLNGSVDPDGAGPASCSFAWGTSTSFGHTASCSQIDIEGFVAVSAEVGGLAPDTTYYYRLRASNGQGTNPGEESEDHQFTTTGPGIAGGTWASQVGSESAVLSASIDPHGAPTYYYFEYGTSSSSYGVDAPVLTPAAPQGALIGSSEGTPLTVSQKIAELAQDTPYYYRVVVVSEVAPGELETFDGAERTFSTEPASSPSTFALADGRRWEMVSPAQKHGSLIQGIAQEGVVQAAVDGDAITYVAGSPTEAEPEGNANGVQVLSTRGATGWTSQDIATPHGQATATVLGKGSEYPLFSPDLSEAIVEPHGAFTPFTGQEASPQASERTVYLRADATCAATPATCYTPLVTAANVAPGVEFGGDPHELRGMQVVGATPDLSHVVLLSHVPLTSTPGDAGGLYEWADGGLQLISIRPESEGGPAGNAGLGHLEASAKNSFARDAVSSDGSHVIWTAIEVPPGGEHTEPHLYMRDTETGHEKSARLDVPQPNASGAGASDPLYQAASSDGSRVFFTDSQALTVGASGTDLYMCEMIEHGGELSCELTNLTSDSEPHGAADVLGTIPGVSEDGSYVYFVASGKLTEGATVGANNLYVEHENDRKWTTTFIAALAGEDNPDWSGQGVQGLAGLTSRVSPNGRYLAFMSNEQLTGYDNHDVVSGMPDEEVYLYDALVGKLVCASCNPTGARPAGVETDPHDEVRLVEGYNVWPHGTWIAANVPGWTTSEAGVGSYQSRYLSNSGRLFFNSSDALVPQDVNGNEDVYEYEPPSRGDESEGDCTISTQSGGDVYVPQAAGCVGLISSGTASEEAAFLDASESGGDVFFLTSSALLAQDFDDSPDIYDAHECTAASPCLPEVTEPSPPCSSEAACKVSPMPQPEIFGAAGSATFSGAGNPAYTQLSTVKVKAKSLTRAQKLAAALRTCRKKAKQKRTACEKQARRAYGATRKAKKPAGRTKNSADVKRGAK